MLPVDLTDRSPCWVFKNELITTYRYWSILSSSMTSLLEHGYDGKLGVQPLKSAIVTGIIMGDFQFYWLELNKIVNMSKSTTIGPHSSLVRPTSYKLWHYDRNKGEFQLEQVSSGGGEAAWAHRWYHPLQLCSPSHKACNAETVRLPWVTPGWCHLWPNFVCWFQLCFVPDIPHLNIRPVGLKTHPLMLHDLIMVNSLDYWEFVLHIKHSKWP